MSLPLGQVTGPPGPACNSKEVVRDGLGVKSTAVTTEIILFNLHACNVEKTLLLRETLLVINELSICNSWKLIRIS